jgi:hypothetical protein
MSYNTLTMTNTTNTNQPTDSNGNNLINVHELTDAIEEHLEDGQFDDDDMVYVMYRNGSANCHIAMTLDDSKEMLLARFNKVVNGLGVIVDAS